MPTRLDRLRWGGFWWVGQSRHKHGERGRSLVVGGVGYERIGGLPERRPCAYLVVRVA
jgi:hypothetical protein